MPALARVRAPTLGELALADLVDEYRTGVVRRFERLPYGSVTRLEAALTFPAASNAST
jgi:hypothetical protein